MPIDAIVGMGTAVNGHINSLTTSGIICGCTVQPFKRSTGIADRVSDLQEDQSDFPFPSGIKYDRIKVQRSDFCKMQRWLLSFSRQRDKV